MKKQNIFKKSLILFLIITLVLPASIFPLHVSAAQSAYNLIEATTLDKEVSKAGQGELQFMSNRIGSIWPQGYLVYRGIDFGKESPLTVEATAGARAGHATALKIMIDSPNSDPIAIVPITQIEFAVGVSNSVPLLKEVTGVHDVYITTVSDTMNFFSFQFFGIPEEKATYEKYSGKSRYADVEDEELKRSIELLSQLGIFSLDGELLDENMPVTRGEFAQSVYGIYRDLTDESAAVAVGASDVSFSDVSPDYPYSDAIRYLAGIGIMKGVAPEKFSPMGFISELDAITALVRVLNLEQLAEFKGGYPSGYLKVASSNRLTIGGGFGGDTLRRGNMIRLLCNLLEANYLSPSAIVGDDIIYESLKGVLAETRHVYHSSGTVTASYFSMLGLPDSSVPMNTVAIDGVYYKVGKTYANDLLGMNCDFYYQEKNGVKTLKAIIPSFDTEITDISSAADEILAITDDEIVYVPAGEEKEETIEIARNSHIIYNGVAAEASLETMLSHEDSFTGMIRVVENSDDTQCIIVEEYADYIVSSIGHDQCSIIAADDKGTLSWSWDDVLFVENAAGELVEFKTIKSGDLLTVYESKNNTNGKKLFRMFISDSELEGRINKIVDDKFYIDGVHYRVSNNGDTLELGQEGIFRLNIYGEVVKFELKKPDAWSTGLYMGFGSNGSAVSENLLVKIMTTDAMPQIYEVAERITVDGIPLRTNDDKKDKIRDVMELEEAVRYRINSENKLYALDTYRYGDNGPDDILNRLHANGPSGKVEFMYIASAMSLFNKSKNNFDFYTPKTATVFAFYGEKGDADRENNCVVGTAEIIMKSTNYNVWGDFYSTSGSEYAVDLVVWSTFTDSLDRKKAFVYESTRDGLNSEGDPIKIILGWYDGGKVSYKLDLTGKYDTHNSVRDLLNAKPGDIYRFKLFPDDTIQLVEALFYQGGAAATQRPNNVGSKGYLVHLDKRSANTESSSSYATSRVLLGKITEKTAEYIAVNLEGQDKPLVFKISGSVCVVEKDSRGYRVEKATIDNLSVDDCVFISCSSASPQAIVIYKDGLNL